MHFHIVTTKRFRKTAEKYRHAGRKHVLEAAEEAIQLLSTHDARSLFVLHERWNDHALQGDKRGIRELHLSMDDLLLYRIDETISSVELLNIVNHERLRKKK